MEQQLHNIGAVVIALLGKKKVNILQIMNAGIKRREEPVAQQ